MGGGGELKFQTSGAAMRSQGDSGSDRPQDWPPAADRPEVHSAREVTRPERGTEHLPVAAGQGASYPGGAQPAERGGTLSTRPFHSSDDLLTVKQQAVLRYLSALDGGRAGLLDLPYRTAHTMMTLAGRGLLHVRVELTEKGRKRLLRVARVQR